jgi:solute carrier family 9 (sodium/hydrogen exchanger), member 8
MVKISQAVFISLIYLLMGTSLVNANKGTNSTGTDTENAGEVVQKQHEFAGIHSLLFVGIMVCCLFLGRIIRHYKFYYLPQSCASMLFGFIVGLFLNFIGEEEVSYISFDPSVFFFIILPAIIFDAGHSLKKRDFFRNFTTIMLFAIFGTVVSTLVIGFSLFGLAKAQLIPLNSSNPSEW